MAYSEKLIDHYENPRNVGTLDKNDDDVGTGLVGAPACGDVMRLQIKVGDDGKIADAKFKTFGCGSAIASSSLATSVFLMVSASSTVFPFTNSVTSDEEAMAEPQPKVLNLASSMTPCSFTRIWSFITSPQAGAPTMPVPTVSSPLSKDPTLRGFS